MPTTRRTLLRGLAAVPLAAAAAPAIGAGAAAAAVISAQTITVSVASRSATSGTLTGWELADGSWRIAQGPMPANVGADGVGQTFEGTSRTPAGIFSVAESFGRQPNPGTALPYFQTSTADWWDSNFNSPTYNRHVHQTASPGGASENLYGIGAVYDYAVVIGYNTRQQPGLGSAFFLHVSDGGPTGGCVSVARSSLTTLMRWLNPALNPTIQIGINVTSPTGDPTVGALLDGDLISYQGTVYRMLGGAPLAVTNLNQVGWPGQPRPIYPLTDTAFAGLRQYPADGVFALAAGTVYRFVGGAPIPVSDWAKVGGVFPWVQVDPAALAHAGEAGVWAHVRSVPTSGRFIAAAGTVYRLAGGAPLAVTSWAPFGGVQNYFLIDPVSLANAGGPGGWGHLLATPADGTFLNAAGTVYRVAGGAALAVTDWATVGGIQSYTTVDPAAVANAGGPGAWQYLRAVPRDRTVLVAAGTVFIVAGGAPLPVTDWADIGGIRPYVQVDPAALSNAGSGGGWNALNFYPADGTFLITPDGAVYRVQGGVAQYVPSWDPFGGPQPTVPVSKAAITNAGTGSLWNHLRAG